jgi:hypothetical protein
MRSFLLSAVVIAACTWSAAADPEDAGKGPTVEKRAPGISEADLRGLLTSDLAGQIEVPTGLAFSDENLKFWMDRAKQAHAKAPVSTGNANETYDAIIQIGHYPRKTGKTGGQGRLVNEQEIAALVAVGIVQRLEKLKIKTLLVGADNYNSGLKSKIFLSLHTDSAAKPCSVSPSVGYEKIADAKGMHGIALALAITLELDSQQFMRDNYTTNLSGYYAYRQFNTQYFKGLLEMSELTCPKQEEKLLLRAPDLSANLARAIQFALR